MYRNLRMDSVQILLIYLFLLITYTTAQNTYIITSDGSLELDPPPQFGENISNLATYETGALGWVYDSTKWIIFRLSTGPLPTIEAILPGVTLLCQSFSNITNIYTPLTENNGNILVGWLIGIIILGVVVCIFCIAVLCTCLCVTCCRCFVGKCGADKTQDVTSQRTIGCIVFWSILLILAIAITAGGCAFGIMSAIRFNSYVSDIPSSYGTVVQSVSGLFNGIIEEVDFLYPTQFISTVDAISTRGLSLFNNGFGFSVDELSMELDNAIVILDYITANATLLQEILSNISQLINELNSSAVNITNDLAQAITNCNSLNNPLLTSQCNAIPNNIDNSAIDATSLPDIDSIVGNLMTLDTNQLSEILINVTTQLNSSLGDLTNLNVSNIISTTPFDLSFLMDALISINETVEDLLFTDLLGSESFNFYFNVIEKVIFALSLAIFAVILLLLLLALLGTFLSFIGYEKNRLPSQRNSSSHTGGNCLAVFGYAGFITIILLLPLLIVLFYIGSLSTTICQPVVDRSLVKVISPVVQDCVNLNLSFQIPNQGTVEIKLDLYNILTKCSTSSGSTSNLFEALNATAIIEELTKEAASILNSSVSQILGDIEFNSTINSIGNQFTNVLDQYRTDSYDLNNIMVLPTVLNSSLLRTSINTAKSQLTSIDTILDGLNNASLNSFQNEIQTILNDVTNLESKLTESENKANEDLVEADRIITDLMANIQQINNTLQTSQLTINNILQNATVIIDNLTTEFTQLVNNYGAVYLSYFVENFPGCNFIPIYYDIIVNHGCRGPLDNLNSIWFTLAWAIIFLLFAIIFSFIIARYSQRRKHESGFDEQTDEVVNISSSNEHPPLPPRGSIFANSASSAGIYVQPTAPVQQEGHPPPYTYISDTIEMERITTNRDTPILTTAQFGSEWTHPSI